VEEEKMVNQLTIARKHLKAFNPDSLTVPAWKDAPPRYNPASPSWRSACS
jgi:hypothetical protein